LMQAIEIRESGGPDGLEYVSRAAREPGSGELLVELAAACVRWRPRVVLAAAEAVPVRRWACAEVAGRVLAGGGVGGRVL
ncbi:NAD(P)H-quinone oxidoreductase, partial [Burkholderia pseudomallei]